MKVRLTLKSSNAKTGPIPVSTTHSDSCPPACPLKDGGCYAKGGPVAIVWGKVDELGVDWDVFCHEISRLPAGQLWRHNQAGDLPGNGDEIDPLMLGALSKANKGKRGFSYTHKPVISGSHATRNRKAVEKANKQGFTISLSANSLSHADELHALGIAPIVSLVPGDTPERFTTPAGRRGILCPATTREGVTCASCALCQKQRSIIVGFKAHGFQTKKAEAISNN